MTKFEFFALIPDHPNVLDKRMSVRSQHLAEAAQNVKITFGGGTLNSLPKSEEEDLELNGSAITVVAESKEEAIDMLKKDIYYTSGVWDLKNATIYPFVCGIRVPK